MQRCETDADPFNVTKRGTYALTGAIQVITESFAESMAFGHANAARKLVAKYASWDSPVESRWRGPLCTIFGRL